MYSAKVIADSITDYGCRLTTIEAEYWRAIHGELMTHRMFSRNASSSRAMPVPKMLEQVRTDPAMPLHWGRNQPGMQARLECDEPVMIPRHLVGSWEKFTGKKLSPEEAHFEVLASREQAWRFSLWLSAAMAGAFSGASYHKQVVNRLLEPGQWMRTIITATEWDNFFELRCHPDAQPEMQHLANLMRGAMHNSKPVLRAEDDWHLPYVSEAERLQYPPDLLAKCSTARCARVSYLNHDGSQPDIDKDVALHDKLVGAVPRHASPAEHPAQAMSDQLMHRNFRGWKQYREILELS